MDGASTNRMKIALGIAIINFGGLYKLLVENVGTIRTLAFAPLITLHPDKLQRASPRSLVKDCAGAGFEIIPVETIGGADDAAIKHRIANLDPKEVGEIVIVTADKDYVPPLRTKANEGVTIWWVAIGRPELTEVHAGLSREVRDLCSSSVFRFFDLAKCPGLLAERRKCPSDPRHAGSAQANRNFTKITLRLTNNSPATHTRLYAEIRRLEQEYPGLSHTVDA